MGIDMPIACFNQELYAAFNLETFSPEQHLPGLNRRGLDGLGFSAGANGNWNRQRGNWNRQHGNGS